MRAIIFSVVFIFFTSLALQGFSQENVDFNKKNFPGKKKELKEALKELAAGDALYDLGGGSFTLAIDHYLKVQAFNPNNAMLNYKLGNCFLNSADKKKSIAYFETAD